MRIERESDAEVLLWDGDGTTIENPDVTLTYENDPDVGRPRANLSFRLDLGALGVREVVIDLPLADLRRWHCAAQADTLLVGEQMIDAAADGLPLVEVRELPDENGTVLVANKREGLTRVSAIHLSRPRTMAAPE